jgi:cell division protein FtsZ
MGVGVATGENRAVEAAKKAISSPLLESSIEGAKGVLMNITGGLSLSLYEVTEAAQIVQSAADEEVNLIFGSVINENLNDEIIVTVIATEFAEEAQGTNPFLQQPKKQPEVENKEPQPKANEAAQQDEGNFHRPVYGGDVPDETINIPAFVRQRRN